MTFPIGFYVMQRNLMSPACLTLTLLKKPVRCVTHSIRFTSCLQDKHALKTQANRLYKLLFFFFFLIFFFLFHPYNFLLPFLTNSNRLICISTYNDPYFMLIYPVSTSLSSAELRLIWTLKKFSPLLFAIFVCIPLKIKNSPSIFL